MNTIELTRNAKKKKKKKKKKKNNNNNYYYYLRAKGHGPGFERGLATVEKYNKHRRSELFSFI